MRVRVRAVRVRVSAVRVRVSAVRVRVNEVRVRVKLVRGVRYDQLPGRESDGIRSVFIKCVPSLSFNSHH